MQNEIDCNDYLLLSLLVICSMKFLKTLADTVCINRNYTGIPDK